MQHIMEDKDISSVMCGAFAGGPDMYMVRKLLLVSKSMRTSVLLRYIVEHLRKQTYKRMDIHTMAQIAHVYQCLTKVEPAYMRCFTVTMYELFDLFPVDLNSISSIPTHNSTILHYTDMLISTNIFYVMREWFEHTLRPAYDIGSVSHRDAVSCMMVVMFRCITSRHESKSFPYRTAEFSEAVVRSTIASCKFYQHDRTFKVRHHAHALLETLVNPDLFETTIVFLYESLFATLTKYTKSQDNHVHNLQATIVRILKNTVNIQSATIASILGENSYVQQILLVGLETDVARQHIHFSLCALLCETMRHQEVLQHTECVYLHRYAKKIAQQGVEGSLMYSHALQFILKIFRQPRSTPDYDIVASCVTIMDAMSHHIATNIIVADFQLCVRVLLSRLKLQLGVSSWELVSAMCCRIISSVFCVQGLQKKSVLLEGIVHASKRVSCEYFAVLLQDLRNIYEILSMLDTSDSAAVVRDVVGLLNVPFLRPDSFTPAMTVEYVESTSIPLLFSKLMQSYTETADGRCYRYNCQMVVLSQKIYTFFGLRPSSAVKFALVAFCLKILQNNQQHDSLTCVHAILTDLFSKHQLPDDQTHATPEVMFSLCTQLLTEADSNVAHLRMHLCVFEHITAFGDCFCGVSGKMIVTYCLIVLQHMEVAGKYDVAIQLQCQKIFNMLVVQKVLPITYCKTQLAQISKALGLVRKVLRKHRLMLGAEYDAHIRENRQLRRQLVFDFE